MYMTKLSLEGFRNYTKEAICLGEALNFFVGKNAQGKTNLLEAIYYLANGRSFRGQKDIDLIAWEKPYFRLKADFRVEGSQRDHHLDLYYDALGRKQIKLNDVVYKKIEDLPYRAKTVLFTPDDLAIVKGAPNLRRRFMDQDMEAFDDSFYLLRRKYNRILSQRNELLKDIRARRSPKEDLLPWNQQLVAFGCEVIIKRLQFLGSIVPQARRIHEDITGQPGGFDVRYISSLGQILKLEREQMECHYLALLEKNQDEEIRRGVSLFGPHRDDLVFYENKVDLRTYGSQGQQRTAVLAMKLAEVEGYSKRFQLQPILLLDDVLSELDAQRQEELMGIVTRRTIQTIITGTHYDDNLKKVGNKTSFYVKEGNIIKNAKKT